MNKAIIIGSGFSGLSAASHMAKAGWEVIVLEKQETPGGRARQLNAEGFSFDMGPSWYWMPDVFENYFKHFGKKVSDYYSLQRLDPSYRIYWDDEITDVPADYQNLKNFFEQTEAGSGKQLDKFLLEARYKYETGINNLVHKPGQSITEFLDPDLIKGIFRLDVFTSIKKHIAKYFSNPKLVQMLEFPILFLGALPENTPALYSLMNYADIKLGTWYPRGGMYSIVKGMYVLAKELGVNFYFDYAVKAINIENKFVKSVITRHKNSFAEFKADVVIGSADYHFIETELLPEKKLRSYSDKYWDTRVMAPGCLLYYVGLNKKLNNVSHHSLFFDVSFNEHSEAIYTKPHWPEDPLFYVCTASVTDKEVAPEGYENLFFLIPVAAGLQGDCEELRDKYFDKIIKRFENKIKQSVKEFIVFKKSFGPNDFKTSYNAFKGNAYGLANTLMQTAVLKPSCRSKKIKNLFYTGQLTVPGPGVPPAIISGEVVAREVLKHFD